MKKVQVVITQKIRNYIICHKFQRSKQSEYEHTLQRKGNEDETSTRIRN